MLRRLILCNICEKNFTPVLHNPIKGQSQRSLARFWAPLMVVIPHGDINQVGLFFPGQMTSKPL